MAFFSPQKNTVESESACNMDFITNYISYSNDGVLRWRNLKSSSLRQFCNAAGGRPMRVVLHDFTSRSWRRVIKLDVSVYSLELVILDTVDDADLFRVLFTALAPTLREILIHLYSAKVPLTAITDHLSLLTNVQTLTFRQPHFEWEHLFTRAQSLPRLTGIRMSDALMGPLCPEQYRPLACQIPSLLHLYVNNTRILTTELRAALDVRCLWCLLKICQRRRLRLPTEMWMNIYLFLG